MGAILAIICHFLPNGEQIINRLAWQIPIWALASVMLVRLAMAPYWIWKKDQQEINELQKTLGTPKSQQEAFDFYLDNEIKYLNELKSKNDPDFKNLLAWIVKTSEGFKTAMGDTGTKGWDEMKERNMSGLSAIKPGSREATVDRYISDFENIKKNMGSSRFISSFGLNDLKKFYSFKQDS